MSTSWFECVSSTNEKPVFVKPCYDSDKVLTFRLKIKYVFVQEDEFLIRETFLPLIFPSLYIIHKPSVRAASGSSEITIGIRDSADNRNERFLIYFDFPNFYAP